jgi:acyl-CoA reductase-like NAD-dependent aldehyde dehydrogenase
VHARDQNQAAYLANRLAEGMVGLNTTIKSAPDLSLGGVKNSGIGREPGRFGPGEFLNKKLIHIA